MLPGWGNPEREGLALGRALHLGDESDCGSVAVDALLQADAAENQASEDHVWESARDAMLRKEEEKKGKADA